MAMSSGVLARPRPFLGWLLLVPAALLALWVWRGIPLPAPSVEPVALPPYLILLFAAAVLGGSLNAVAGGGSFLTFPALVFVGIPPVAANATSTVALWPGGWASVAAYRRELVGHRRLFLVILAAVSVAGGLLGALLLLHTPQMTFVRLTPYLLLGATLLFAFGKQTAALTRRWSSISGTSWRRTMVGAGVAQFVIAIYGGYFGGGLGVLMLAALGLLGLDNLHQMNALKTLLAACINGVAVLVFILAGIVAWPQAIIMVVGAIIGGFGGATIARRIDPRWTRATVILVGLAMTTYFFVR